jgi:hypothetical protein
MVYLEKEFATEAEADKFIDDYCQSYRPAGYGTSCRKTKLESGKVTVNVSRGSSCD